MFQLSKKVEYGLIAIRHLAMAPRGKTFTTKEIADVYSIPHELLAKVMQKLTREKYIISYQGAHGGYGLARDPGELRVADIINAIEGRTNVALVKCETEGPSECIIHTTCTIKNPLVKLQGTINRMFSEMTIMEMV
jgi:Rrf2 family protein